MVADLYGSTILPLTGDEARIDPMLSPLVSFFQAIANAYALAEWKVLVPTATACVARAYTHDPHESNFVDNKLPGLFLWRTGSPEWHEESQGIRICRSRLRLLWVPPDTGKPEQKTDRSHFPWKLAKLWDDYLGLGRDPAWIVAGDPDPEAPRYGSVLARFAKFRRLRFQNVQSEPLVIELVAPDGAPRSPPRLYSAMLIELFLEEELTRDPTRNPPLNSVGVDGFIVAGTNDPAPPLPIIPTDVDP